MSYIDSSWFSFKCSICGKLTNGDPRISPRGIYCGQEICESCYEAEFGKQYGDRSEEDTFTCVRCHLKTPVSEMCVDSSGNRYCGKCCDIVTSPDYVEDPEESDDTHSSESDIRDVVRAIYELNDSVRDLCALLKAKL